MQPGLRNQDPRFKSPGHLGSWFLVPRARVALNFSFFNAGFNAAGPLVNSAGHDTVLRSLFRIM